MTFIIEEVHDRQFTMGNSHSNKPVKMIDENSIDAWFREFQINHGDADMKFNGDTLSDLAYLLHDDIPLGYEASMRLGRWLLEIAWILYEHPEQKDCPFCGKIAKINSAIQKEDGTWIPASCGCSNCGVWMHGDKFYGHGGFANRKDYEESLDQAIKRWNKRA